MMSLDISNRNLKDGDIVTRRPSGAGKLATVAREVHSVIAANGQWTTGRSELDDGSKLIAYLILMSIFALVARVVGADAEPEPISTISAYLLIDCSLFVFGRLFVHAFSRLTSNFASYVGTAVVSVLLIWFMTVMYVGSNLRRVPIRAIGYDADPIATLVYAATGLGLHIVTLPLWGGRGPVVGNSSGVASGNADADFDFGVYSSTILGKGSFWQFLVAFATAVTVCFWPQFSIVYLLCVIVFSVPMLMKSKTILTEVIKLIQTGSNAGFASAG